MTDQLTTPPAPARPDAISLSSRGKQWAILLDDGRYLEVARRGMVVTFDLAESARQGRAVVVRIDGGGP
jgi:hypothetical protein